MNPEFVPPSPRPRPSAGGSDFPPPAPATWAATSPADADGSFAYSTPVAASPLPAGPRRAQQRQFAFDGGAGTYVGTAVLGLALTVLTLGIMYPFALVLRERWRAKHSYIEGRQLVFNGSAWGLFGLWWKWLLLSIITLGIYLFWVSPRIARWRWENTSWAQQVPGQFNAAVRG